jgi:hypothetical protein
LKHLRARRVPACQAGEPAALARARAAWAEAEESRHAFEATLATENVRISGVVRSFARDPRFREALTWQNRGALACIDAKFAAHPVGSAGSRRQEQLVAMYLQRYCTKNDTIGFFGPVAWARLGDGPDTIRFRAGPALLSRRRVYFEHWAIDALAQRLSADPELSPYLVRRRNPATRLEGATLHYPIEKRSDLEPVFARTLECCTGEHSARAIAEILLADESLELECVDDVFEVLDVLEKKGLILSSLAVPAQDAYPEVALRRALEELPDAPTQVRRAALAVLDDVEQCRDEVAAAAGDAAALDRKLADLDKTFSEATGVAATRRQGEMYAGRTVVYEDCIRGVTIDLGRPFLERIGPALALLLHSARWFTCVLAERYDRLFDEIFERLSNKTLRDTVDFLRFWDELVPHLTGAMSGKAPPLAREVADELATRWTGILDIRQGDRRLERSADLLADAVHRAFPAPRPGWPAARHQPPDILLASQSLERLAAGEYVAVLGELHHAMTNLANPALLKEHPNPTELITARELDLPDPGISPLEAREHVTRADYRSISRHDLHLELGATRSWRPREQVIEAGELVVERVDRVLFVRTRDGRRRFAATAFFEQHLTAAANLARFRVVPPRPHAPRVTLGGLVVHREAWRMKPDELTFAHQELAAARFSGARRWARALGVPRFVFVNLPEEAKPVYVDLDSPLYVEIFAKLIRKASDVVISEMLPSVQDAWLEDATGAHYTCELRAAAVDPMRWKG